MTFRLKGKLRPISAQPAWLHPGSPCSPSVRAVHPTRTVPSIPQGPCSAQAAESPPPCSGSTSQGRRSDEARDRLHRQRKSLTPSRSQPEGSLRTAPEAPDLTPCLRGHCGEGTGMEAVGGATLGKRVKEALPPQRRCELTTEAPEGGLPADRRGPVSGLWRGFRSPPGCLRKPEREGEFL